MESTLARCRNLFSSLFDFFSLALFSVCLHTNLERMSSGMTHETRHHYKSGEVGLKSTATPVCYVNEVFAAPNSCHSSPSPNPFCLLSCTVLCFVLLAEEKREKIFQTYYKRPRIYCFVVHTCCHRRCHCMSIWCALSHSDTPMSTTVCCCCVFGIVILFRGEFGTVDDFKVSQHRDKTRGEKDEIFIVFLRSVARRTHRVCSHRKKILWKLLRRSFVSVVYIWRENFCVNSSSIWDGVERGGERKCCRDRKFAAPKKEMKGKVVQTPMKASSGSRSRRNYRQMFHPAQTNDKTTFPTSMLCFFLWQEEPTRKWV